MTHAVYAYGMISSSTFYELPGAFPQPDTYAEIGREFRMTGGEATNSSIVLSRLGVRVKLSGNILGFDREAQQLMELLKEYKIDLSSVEQKQGVRTVKEIVFSDPEHRTGFGTYCDLLFKQKTWSVPNEQDIAACKVVSLDPFFEDSSVQVARYGRKYQKPVITVDAPYEGDAAALSDVIVIAGEFRGQRYPGRSIEDLFQAYRDNVDGLVIMTAGKGEIIYGTRDSELKRFPTFSVDTVDTTGAGDSFRAGIVYGYLQSWEVERTLEFASGVAAVVCTRYPGVINSPTLDEVTSLIRKHRA